MSFSAFENWQTKREQIGLKTDHLLLGYNSEMLQIYNPNEGDGRGVILGLFSNDIVTVDNRHPYYYSLDHYQNTGKEDSFSVLALQEKGSSIND